MVALPFYFYIYMGWGLYTQLLNSLIISENRDGDLNTRKHCRGAISNTQPSVSRNIYLVDTSKLVLIISTMPRFSTCFSVSRSSDETCVVIDELHLNVFAITGPSALKCEPLVNQHFEGFYFGRVSLLERTKLYTRWDDFSLLCYWLQC